MEAAAALVTPDVDFINVFGRWLKGRPEFVEHHRRLHCVQMRNSTWINLNHEIRFIHGDLAIVHLEWTIEGDQDPDGTPRGRRKGLFTWVLSREDDGWLIMAAHNTNLHPGVGHRLTPVIGSSVARKRYSQPRSANRLRASRHQ
jgi:uncharacterized protein (TIGR02246 family)